MLQLQERYTLKCLFDKRYDITGAIKKIIILAIKSARFMSNVKMHDKFKKYACEI